MGDKEGKNAGKEREVEGEGRAIGTEQKKSEEKGLLAGSRDKDDGQGSE